MQGSASSGTPAAARAALMQRLFPAGVPTLWCPLLTHYTAAGTIDRQRMRKHLDFLQPSVKGYLIPGSTGDGWQLSDAEIRELLEFMIDEARRRGMNLLFGVLKTSADEVLASLDDTVAWLKQRTGAATTERCLAQSAIRGFTVCPPKGGALTQEQLRSALDRILSKGLPTALYQLPQVTENEMSAQTVSWLAERHANFFMLKDTSGADRVAAAGVRDIFLVRGAEGGYSTHLRSNGGNYDGFLLSTANCFGPQLAEVISDLAAGNAARAQALSDRIARVVDAVFEAAAKLAFGNPFTNANKAIDHFMAFGPEARRLPGPRLHSGDVLPTDLVEVAESALAREGLLPTQGYLVA